MSGLTWKTLLGMYLIWISLEAGILGIVLFVWVTVQQVKELRNKYKLRRLLRKVESNEIDLSEVDGPNELLELLRRELK